MDLIGGLTAARLALDLAKDLREIDRSVDEAAFKLKLADLTSALADTQLALADAKIQMAELHNELEELRTGETCPKCRNGRLQLVYTEDYPMYGLGALGVEEWVYQCDNPNCQFETKRLNDPHGAVAARAKSI